MPTPNNAKLNSILKIKSQFFCKKNFSPLSFERWAAQKIYKVSSCYHHNHPTTCCSSADAAAANTDTKMTLSFFSSLAWHGISKRQANNRWWRSTQLFYFKDMFKVQNSHIHPKKDFNVQARPDTLLVWFGLHWQQIKSYLTHIHSTFCSTLKKNVIFRAICNKISIYFT